jgi:signal transduction histidine kinase
LSNTEEYLTLEISNEIDADAPAVEFVPKSILQRVQIFNGELHVERNSGCFTVVRAILPIERG